MTAEQVLRAFGAPEIDTHARPTVYPINWCSRLKRAYWSIPNEWRYVRIAKPGEQPTCPECLALLK